MFLVRNPKNITKKSNKFHWEIHKNLRNLKFWRHIVVVVFEILFTIVFWLTSSALLWIHLSPKAFLKYLLSTPTSGPFSTCPLLKYPSTPTIVTQSVIELLACTAPCSNIKTNNETHMYISNFSKLLQMIVTSHGLGDLGNSQKKTSPQNCQSYPLSPGHNIFS